MGKQSNNQDKSKNFIFQSVCMLLVCFGLIAGAAPNARAISNTTTTPVMESVEVVGTDFVLTWSQPESVYGAPDGGYDIFIDGVDTNKKHRTTGLSATISGLEPGMHTFKVEARYTEVNPSEFNRSNELSATLEANTSTISQSTTTPVLESVEVVGTDFVLTWSQPESVYGEPDGGYDVFIDGVDQNNHHQGLSTTIGGLAPGEHTFQVEARYIEVSPKEFNRSNVVSAVLEETVSAPEETTVSDSTTTPVLESVEVVGTDFVLTWSQPESVYGEPDGGYDVFIDGVDQNNHHQGLSTTIGGLAPGEHTFQVEARYTEVSPKEFNRSNVVSAVLEETVSAPEETTVSDSTTTPVLESVEVVGTDFVLTWSQPESVYGEPDGGYDVFIDGVDQNNHHQGLSTTIGGLAPGEHTFQVEARYIEVSPKEFNRSNVVSAVLEETVSAPEETTVSDSTTAPVLESVEVVGTDFVLTWSQPESVYGEPDGGYDVFIDGVDQNNHHQGLSTTISGLTVGTHTFAVEARYTEISEFPRSNEMSATSETATSSEPVVETAPAPVMESVEVSGTDFILTWSQPDTSYGAPDGGYDVFIDGVDQNNHLQGLTTTISGLPAGTHTFSVEARYTETSEFPRSNELSATSEGSTSTDSGEVVNPDLGYLPVFPGAQGFGTETKAGRGGKIIKVTNLNNSGSGSLRAALEASGPRIVVFEVSGTIVLTNAIRIRNPYLTLAGQTAPSPGISVKGAVIDVRTHDVLIQHIRSRIGDDNPGDITPENLDAMQIRELGTSENPEKVENVILDHVSLSWAVDENLGLGGKYTAHDLTISNCIVSEALYDSIHPKGAHSMGILVGDRTKNVTLIGNLLAHNRGRNGGNWKGDTSGVALNNLLYNAGYVNYIIGDNYNSGPAYISLIGNVAIDGVNTPNNNPLTQFQSSISPGTKIHLAGNKVDSGNLFNNSASFDPRVSSPPVWHPSLVVRDSSKVESWVLANAGARPADRDAVDERVVNEVKSRSGNRIDSQQEVGGWPTLEKNYRAFPTPDSPHGDDDGDGYTNIEEVLHQMAAQVEGR